MQKFSVVCKLFSGVAGTHDGEEDRRHQAKVGSSWAEWGMALPLATTCQETWLWQIISLPVPLLLLNSLLFLLVTFPSSKDPYLTSQYAIQFVKGMQFGNDLRYVLNYAWLAGTRGPNTHQYWFELWLGLGHNKLLCRNMVWSLCFKSRAVQSTLKILLSFGTGISSQLCVVSILLPMVSTPP